MNFVALAGRLGKDPETSYTQSGTAKTTFSLATSEKFKNKAGDTQEQTQWHNIIVWGKRAEHVAKYLSKGSYVIVRGSIEYQSWDDQKTGDKKYKTQIKASDVEFGPKTSSGGGRYAGQQGGGDQGGGYDSGNDGGGYAGGGGGPDEDIPF